MVILLPLFSLIYVGSVDPWHALGVTHDLGHVKAIVIDGTAHCAGNKCMGFCLFN